MLDREGVTLNILFVADVFGAPGRRAIESRLASLRQELAADFCIVNGENAAAGRGITAKLADKLLASGADVVTLGNWVWGQQDFAPYLSGTDRVLRPANLSPRTPGVGLAVHDGVAVINLLGIFALQPFENPFLAADRLVEEALRSTPVIVVDFHAEATSEKVALARYLDGRVTAVLGTHTHVQTNDARVLAGGTAAITDAGMTGPHDSVIGSDEHNALKRFLTGMPTRLEPATRGVRIEGVLVECTADGRATSCTAVRVEIE
jgi:metallophosphoesterase (TIGR00282 family)